MGSEQVSLSRCNGAQAGRSSRLAGVYCRLRRSRKADPRSPSWHLQCSGSRLHALSGVSGEAGGKRSGRISENADRGRERVRQHADGGFGRSARPKDFLDWREKVARTSGEREADNRLSAISAMLTWSVDRGLVAANYLRGFKRLYHGDRSEIIWLPEHIAAFMRVASIEMQRALIFALHTGQREGDLLRLPWSSYDGLRIALRQGKARRGGKRSPLVEIPCTAALRQMLDGMDRVSTLILTTKTGRSLKKRYFARLWDEAMIAAKLQSVTLPGSDERVRCISMISAERQSRSFRRPDARRSRLQPSPGTRSRRFIASWSVTLPERAASPSRQSSILRTHRDKVYKTNCKP